MHLLRILSTSLDPCIYNLDLYSNDMKFGATASSVLLKCCFPCDCTALNINIIEVYNVHYNDLIHFN